MSETKDIALICHDCGKRMTEGFAYHLDGNFRCHECTNRRTPAKGDSDAQP
jgi:formylmethanofuran dehydrogenase subunit E